MKLNENSILIITCCVLFSCFCTSCDEQEVQKSKEEQSEERIVVPLDGMPNSNYFADCYGVKMYAGIEDVACTTKDKHLVDTRKADYENMVIWVSFSLDDGKYNPDVIEERDNHVYNSYFLSFVGVGEQIAYYNYPTDKGVKSSWENKFLLPCRCVNARVNGKVSITADRKLFGKSAGEDISDMFNVIALEPGVLGGDMEHLEVIYDMDNIPSDVNEYFCKDSWLMRNVAFQLKELPEERPESVTFTVSLPIKKELWYEYMQKQVLDSNAKMPTEEVVLSAACHFVVGMELK